MRTASLSLSLLLLIGCKNENMGRGGDGGTGGQDMASNAATVPLGIGPLNLAAGEERTICSTFRLPTTKPIDVVQIDTVLAPGSHHLIVYKSMDTVEKKA